MSLGVTPGSTSVLRLRKANDKLTVEGEPPQTHSFSTGYVERELNDAIRLHIIVQAEEALVYEVTHIDRNEYTATLLPDSPGAPPKRRWWQRRKK